MLRLYLFFLFFFFLHAEAGSVRGWFKAVEVVIAFQLVYALTPWLCLSLSISCWSPQEATLTVGTAGRCWSCTWHLKTPVQIWEAWRFSLCSDCSIYCLLFVCFKVSCIHMLWKVGRSCWNVMSHLNIDIKVVSFSIWNINSVYVNLCIEDTFSAFVCGRFKGLNLMGLLFQCGSQCICDSTACGLDKASLWASNFSAIKVLGFVSPAAHDQELQELKERSVSGSWLLALRAFA